jgi:hypothetical protein
MVTAMMGVSSPEQASQMIGSNLIVSNVRGSDRPMYVAGARLDTMYPMSIITPGMGINFTCVSYVEQVDVGVAIEPQLVPDPWRIIDGLQLALDQYLGLAGKRKTVKTAARKKAASRPKQGTRKKSVAKRKPPLAARRASAKAHSV